MAEFSESVAALRSWGARLRSARLARNDTMRVFSQRLGVSESTVRDMERGAPTVQIGTWLNAFAVLDRIGDLEHALEPRESLIDRARLARHVARVRARTARS
jgi:transcriptional regulator with XRE-family HTH domain